jgi:uncharacterized membrane protein
LLWLGVTLAAGLLLKAPCARPGPASERSIGVLCYTDIVPLYGAEGLSERRVPYFDARNEYPILTGAWMYATSLPVTSSGSFFLVNAAGLAVLAAVTTVALYRAVGSRALYFAAAPSLLLYGFLNWDLLALTLGALGTLAFLDRREIRAGILLGLGTAAKVFPALFVVPFAWELRRRGAPAEGSRLVGSSAGAWLLVNLPVALLAFQGWTYFFRFNSERGVNEGTIWFVFCNGFGSCRNPLFARILPLVAFLAGSVLALRWAIRRAPERARWTLAFPLLIVFLLTTKVYSPQYDLWLLPWFALVWPRIRPFAFFQATSIAVYFTTFSWMARDFGGTGLPLWTVEAAVVARAAALLTCLIWFIAQRSDADLDGRTALEISG